MQKKSSLVMQNDNIQCLFIIQLSGLTGVGCVNLIYPKAPVLLAIWLLLQCNSYGFRVVTQWGTTVSKLWEQAFPDVRK